MKSSMCAWVLGLGLIGVAHAGNIDKLNGDINVAAGDTVADVSTVNGDIQVGARATIAEAETVNGSITLGEQAKAKSVEAVNGDVELGTSAHVGEDVETVNGDITLRKGAQVRGEVSNVSGTIALHGAHVGDGLETVTGDITVGAGSHVEGGILVEKPDNGWFNNSDSHVPRIVIGPDAVVEGVLDFRREVELYVSDRARIGTVKGAQAHMFSGDRP